MKPSLYHKLSRYEKHVRLKTIWPLYVLGVILAYWKLDFWLASVITAILIILTFMEIYFLKKNYEKYLMLETVWPVYILGIIMVIGKVDFTITSIIIAISIILTLIRIHFLKKKFAK
ncbi:hypothetical protein [Clostridium brassicae]|uniref:Phosphatidate cytidylyltransferase n=1 Tax=Clostridium brassicae TaxID=2999072 RepID=A0ABT4D998_9CLOT|nr:hypothetical protein [Clostridium brassicae]MCY6957766.1 hypothetical protein [Clostridium brassicae]